MRAIICARIISNACGTTNCLAPIAKVLSDNFGIENGYMTTIHAYTNDQNILDNRHSDLRQARSAAQSMVPTSTGRLHIVTCPARTEGKLDGSAIRVPTANVSADFTGKRDVTKEEG